MFLLKRLQQALFGVHKWKYRNPYDRRCEICGRREVSHCASLETWNRCWWEAFDEGDMEKHRG